MVINSLAIIFAISTSRSQAKKEQIKSDFNRETENTTTLEVNLTQEIIKVTRSNSVDMRAEIRQNYVRLDAACSLSVETCLLCTFQYSQFEAGLIRSNISARLG